MPTYAFSFDELHFGKYVGMYVKKIFFFDLHPPLGKLLISGVAYLAGFDGIGFVDMKQLIHIIVILILHYSGLSRILNIFVLYWADINYDL